MQPKPDETDTLPEGTRAVHLPISSTPSARFCFGLAGATLAQIGFNPNNGIGSLADKLSSLPATEKEAIEATIKGCYASRPALAMVDSDRGLAACMIVSALVMVS